MGATTATDDPREAAKLNAGVGMAVIAGAATTIAAATALLAFSVGNFSVSWVAGVAWAGAYSLLFASAVCGGIGLREVMRRGAAGDWSAGVGRAWFSGQAVLYVGGVAVLATAALVAFGGDRRSDQTGDQIDDLVRQSEILSKKATAAAASAESTQTRLRQTSARLRADIGELQREVAALRMKTP